MDRKIETSVKGYQTEDGAGVKLVRVLGRKTVKHFDPLLMLDSFDSTNPEDYKAGFPLHPHRGIETVSYLSSGAMTHKDSLGNEDTITDGEIQWMTAGLGIMHSEMLPASDRLLGVQLWLNLPAKDKMTKPYYKAIKKEEVQEIEIEGGKLKLLAGAYKNYRGYQAQYLPFDYYDIQIEKGSTIRLETEMDQSISLFTLVGDIRIAGEIIEEKTALHLTQGDRVTIEALSDQVQVLYMGSERLDEPVAWDGPIVMNTDEELREASLDLANGTFIRDELDFNA